MAALSLPDEYTFDVSAARAQLATLAQKSPETFLTLTLAQLGQGGLEAESDIRLRAPEAAALLEQVGEDQRIAGKAIYVLRITEWRSETPPAPPRDDP